MVCKLQLTFCIDDQDEIPFKVIRTLGSVINYGGRVTDDKDERFIRTLIKYYIHPDMIKITEDKKFYFDEQTKQQENPLPMLHAE